MIAARPYRPELREAWNGLNRAAANGHFLFDRGFMEYHADRFADASLAVFDDDRLVAIMPANRDGETVWSHQGLTFGGLVSERTGAVAGSAMLDACAAAWRAAGGRSLVYKALPPIYHQRPAQGDLYWLFRRGAELARRDVTTAIDYAARGPVSQRRLRGARKAAAAGVTFGLSERWADYWDLLSGVLAARHAVAPTHSLAEITALAAAFPAEISLHVAERGGAVEAGVVMFVTPRVAHAQYIAVGDEGRADGALDGLFDHLIAGFEGRVRWFDFGVSTTDQGRVLNEGLAAQKEDFGGGPVMHDTWRVGL